MNTQIVIQHKASLEITQASIFYENRKPGLANAFVAQINKKLKLIAEFPESFAIKGGKSREANLEIFPYSILYEIKTDKIAVVSVFHQKTDPRKKVAKFKHKRKK